MEKEEKEYIKKCLTIYNEIKEKGARIQEKYSFIIPEYVLEEIIIDNIIKEKLILFINIAKINNRITEEEANILKQDFIFNKR